MPEGPLTPDRRHVAVDADSIAEVFSRMVVAQIEMFEKK